MASAQSGSRTPGAPDPLQQHYGAAQTLQRQGKIDDAARQYHGFLSDILGELAVGYSVARDYPHAAPLFDAALSFEPDSPSLLLAYARSAVALGDPAHAKTLAARLIRSSSATRSQLAEAHQVLGRALLLLNQDQPARKELEAAVDLDPTFPNGYDLAVACLDLGDQKCATQLFSEMEKSFGDTPQIHLMFGRAYGESDFQPQAIPEFRRAIAEDPRLPGVHYLLAAILLATGDDQAHVTAAEEELKKELAISPRDAMSYAALGKIAANQGNDPEGETCLKKAVALDPRDPDAWLYLGQIDFDTHRAADAETALRRSIQLTADVSRNRYQVQKAHFLLGRILMQKGQQDAAHAEMATARDLANRALAVDKSKLAALMDPSGQANVSGPAPASANTATADRAGIDPVAEHRVEAMRHDATDAIADSYSNLAVIAATRSNYSDAMNFFGQAALWNPSLPGLDYNWGRAAFAGSRFADAVPPLSRYVNAHLNDPGARSVLGISQFMTGDDRGCIQTLQPIIGGSDLAPQVEYTYAQALVKTGQVTAGAERLAALEKAHPEISDVHRAAGEALALEGKKAQAAGELRTAIRLNPRDADARYDLGCVELEDGDVTAAVTDVETAVRLAPGTAKFHEELAKAYRAASRPADAQKETEASQALRAHTQSSLPHVPDGARP
jgi:tetratricopeptide (TPR) repeat protein